MIIGFRFLKDKKPAGSVTLFPSKRQIIYIAAIAALVAAIAVISPVHNGKDSVLTSTVEERYERH